MVKEKKKEDEICLLNVWEAFWFISDTRDQKNLKMLSLLDQCSHNTRLC